MAIPCTLLCQNKEQKSEMKMDLFVSTGNNLVTFCAVCYPCLFVLPHS